MQNDFHIDRHLDRVGARWILLITKAPTSLSQFHWESRARSLWRQRAKLLLAFCPKSRKLSSTRWARRAPHLEVPISPSAEAPRRHLDAIFCPFLAERAAHSLIILPYFNPKGYLLQLLSLLLRPGFLFTNFHPNWQHKMIFFLWGIVVSLTKYKAKQFNFLRCHLVCKWIQAQASQEPLLQKS